MKLLKTLPGARRPIAIGAVLLAAVSLQLPGPARATPSPVVGGTRAAQGEFPFMVRLSMGCAGLGPQDQGVGEDGEGGAQEPEPQVRAEPV
ncbi:hypothetical protein ACWD6I_22605, partial [Streptomyces sp. NPDC002454]